MSNDPQVVVVKVQDDSILFPVITLICYFVLFPLGVILNIIGLITGPKRGCFAVLLFLALLPALLLFTFILSLLGISSFMMI